jgi:hypothetical protein
MSGFNSVFCVSNIWFKVKKINKLKAVNNV